MSHRTQHLDDSSGFQRWLNQLRYKEIYRQSIGIILLPIFAALALPYSPWWQIGGVLVVLGCVIRIWAAGVVMKNQVLATHGPYALVRHPLYVGNILVLVGMALVSGRWWLGLVTLLFFWFFYPPAIRYEDRKLKDIFGESWEQWASKISALVPSFSNISKVKGNWSPKLAAGRNGEFYIIGFIIVCYFWAVYF